MTSDNLRGRSAELTRLGVPAALLALAALGWWWSARMAADMGASPMDGMVMHHTETAITIGTFVVAWLAMMTAMMFPAISPVVKLYARAASAGRVAPLPVFVAGYIAVWTSLGVPAFFAWRALMEPVAEGRPWAARLAGGIFIAAAVWQLTPLKSVCLRHCRSPMSVFLRYGSSLERPSGALRTGVVHGAYCVGCCWALMAVLVSLGTMNLAWMLALAVLIFIEKNAAWGEGAARVAAVGLLVLGVALIAQPRILLTLT